MKTYKQTVRVGEWLGDVPKDWDYDSFYEKYFATNREHYDRSIELFNKMAEALKQEKVVYAIQSGGFKHEAYHCGLYDGWPFWKPRPCYAYIGPIPGEHVDEFYNLIDVEIKER